MSTSFGTDSVGGKVVERLSSEDTWVRVYFTDGTSLLVAARFTEGGFDWLSVELEQEVPHA